MQYGALLARAWHIVWRNKIIWVFGFLAALGSGSGGGGSNGGGGSRANFNLPPSGQGGEGNLPPDVQRALTELLSNQGLILAIIVAIFLVALVIGLLIAFLSALGHGAMVEMVREADETERTSFATGWNTGLRRMLPVFLIRFLLGLPPAIIIIAGLIPFVVTFLPLLAQPGMRDAQRLFAGGVLTWLFACFAPACCIGVLLTIPLSVLESLSIRALVLEDRGVLGGIRRGWVILTGNLGEVVVVWLIFLLLGIGVAIVIGLPLAFVALAVFVPLGIATIISPIMIVPLCLGGLLLWVLGAVLQSVVEAYKSTVWTLAYRQWTARSVPVVTTA